MKSSRPSPDLQEPHASTAEGSGDLVRTHLIEVIGHHEPIGKESEGLARSSLGLIHGDNLRSSPARACLAPLQALSIHRPAGRLARHLGDDVEVRTAVNHREAEPLGARRDEQIGQGNSTMASLSGEQALHFPGSFIVPT